MSTSPESHPATGFREETLEASAGQLELQGPSLLDSVVGVSRDKAAAQDGRLQRFLSETRPGKALESWFGRLPRVDKRTLTERLNRDVASIDQLLTEQINAILHHPRFQKLEASWRGLEYLVDRCGEEADQNIKVKVLPASWKDLERDFERATEFDQSQLFRKVYEQEFGNPGGEPYGVLLGDYEIHPAPGPGHPHDDIGILQSISQVAAAAFCPFITAAGPEMFGLDEFGTLEHSLNHAKTLEQTEFLKWRALRETEDSRFLGLVLPRVLMRKPFQDDGRRVDQFCFREDVSGPDRSKYLWGNAVYAFGGVVMRAHAEAGWLADIRGVRRDTEGGGLVTGLPAHCFGTDRFGIAPQQSTDVVITDALEKELSDLGFMPLCDCKDTEYSAFYSNPSIQKARKYDRAGATANAKISAMLQYMLCVSRFAHYVKVLGRDKTGTFAEAENMEQFLRNWIMRYVTADGEATPDVKARFPLREANVQVREQPGRPGSFQCVMHLSPHYELDELNATVRVVTELAPPRTV